MASAAIGLLAFRAFKRSRSPIIETKFCCPCGKVKGTIRAKYEDSSRIHCCCTDCRAYTKAVAALGGKVKPLIHDYGEAHLCQVCKSDVTIDEGLEHIKLARKGPSQGMHRYYTGCCSVPLMNTFDFLGFVALYEDHLDEHHKQFHGPSVFCEHEAEKPFDLPIPKASTPRFLWNVLRYMPWRHSGPFDYTLEPLYWGDNKKKN
ncbi:unnamed protein product [Cylindrotheca closterium]|uniref:CENP-V/GFA domain-containing protein n=1 Tax=Cylindrotheca closterium TaxID=2856 RepID=A0AAD2CGJ2_9STRA|nr:unnamed protein product [Cylindrotheca closterium]